MVICLKNSLIRKPQTVSLYLKSHYRDTAATVNLPEKPAYQEAPDMPLYLKSPLSGCPRSGHLPDKLSPSRNIGVKLDRCVLPHAFDLELRLRQ